MKLYTTYLTLVLMTLSFLSCSNKEKKNELNFLWQPSTGASPFYPSRIVFGSLSAGDKYIGLPTGSVQNNPWGDTGLTMGDANFVPDRLTIGWFSFAENKFYKGDFKLPVDTIRALFEQGLHMSNGIFRTYNRLIISTYPTGRIAVWMMITGNRNVEIAHFQGEEMEYKWKDMYRSMQMERNDFVKEIMTELEGGAEYLAKHGVSPEPYKTVYRQRYPYTFELDSDEDDKIEVESYFVEFFNGELDLIQDEEIQNNFFKEKALPKYSYIKWKALNNLYGADVYFDEEEVFAAFKEMYKTCPGEATKLVFQPDESYTRFNIFLRSATMQIELRKTRNIVFQRTR